MKKNNYKYYLYIIYLYANISECNAVILCEICGFAVEEVW